MGGVFRTFQNLQDSAAKINPLSKTLAKVDPAGNLAGTYGRNAPAPIAALEPIGTSMGMYGSDTSASDAATFNSERIKAIQSGETDMGAVNTRTSQMLKESNPGRKTVASLFGG